MTHQPNDCNQPEKLSIEKIDDPPVIGRGSPTGTLEDFKRKLRTVLKRRKLFRRPGGRFAALILTLLVFRAEAGVTSWYGEEHRGKLMANGRPFDPEQLTAASWFYPLGTRVRVRAGSRSVVVEITDRGPAHRLVRQGRTLDLSCAAFKRLANPKQGLVKVSVSKLR